MNSCDLVILDIPKYPEPIHFPPAHCLQLTPVSQEKGRPRIYPSELSDGAVLDVQIHAFMNVSMFLSSRSRSFSDLQPSVVIGRPQTV